MSRTSATQNPKSTNSAFAWLVKIKKEPAAKKTRKEADKKVFLKFILEILLEVFMKKDKDFIYQQFP